MVRIAALSVMRIPNDDELMAAIESETPSAPPFLSVKKIVVVSGGPAPALSRCCSATASRRRPMRFSGPSSNASSPLLTQNLRRSHPNWKVTERKVKKLRNLGAEGRSSLSSEEDCELFDAASGGSKASPWLLVPLEQVRHPARLPPDRKGYHTACLAPPMSMSLRQLCSISPVLWALALPLPSATHVFKPGNDGPRAPGGDR